MSGMCFHSVKIWEEHKCRCAGCGARFPNEDTVPVLITGKS